MVADRDRDARAHADADRQAAAQERQAERGLAHDVGQLLGQGPAVEQDTRIAEHWRRGSAIVDDVSDARVRGARRPPTRARRGRHPDHGRARRRSGFTALPAGTIRLEPAVGGARFPPRLLAPLLQAFAPNEPLVVVEPEHARCRLIDVGDDARRMWNALVKHGDTFPPESHARCSIGWPRSMRGCRSWCRRAHGRSARRSAGGRRAAEACRRRRCSSSSRSFASRRRADVPAGRGPARRDDLARRRRGYVRRDFRKRARAGASALARLPLDTAEEGPPMCFALAEPDAALAVVAAPATTAGARSRMGRRRADDRELGRRERAARPDRSRSRLVRHHRPARGRSRQARARGVARCGAPPTAVRAARRASLDRALCGAAAAARRARRSDVHDARDHSSCRPARCRRFVRSSMTARTIETAPSWRLMTERLAAAASAAEAAGDAARRRCGRIRSKVTRGWRGSRRGARRDPRRRDGARQDGADDGGAARSRAARAGDGGRADVGDRQLGRRARALRADAAAVVLRRATDRAATLATLGKKDVLISSYGLLARDAERWPRLAFATLVLDEAQAVKNPRTERAKAARAARRRVPDRADGHAGREPPRRDLEPVRDRVPGLLGSWEQFRDALRRADRARSRRRGARALARCCGRSSCGAPRPRSRPSCRRAPRSGAGRLSNEERRSTRTRGSPRSRSSTSAGKPRDEQLRFVLLAALTRLRQLACHPRSRRRARGASSKAAPARARSPSCAARATRARVQPVPSLLELCAPRLSARASRCSTSTARRPPSERASGSQAFQAGEADVFLISLKAGGIGLNLTAADT